MLAKIFTRVCFCFLYVLEAYSLFTNPIQVRLNYHHTAHTIKLKVLIILNSAFIHTDKWIRTSSVSRLKDNRWVHIKPLPTKVLNYYHLYIHIDMDKNIKSKEIIRHLPNGRKKNYS